MTAVAPAERARRLSGIGYAYRAMGKMRRNGTQATTMTAPEPPAEATVGATAGPHVGDALRSAAEAVWVAAQKGAPWATLALVPAEPGLRTDALARAVAEVGSGQRGERVEFRDLRGATLANSRTLVDELADDSRPSGRVVALGCPTDDHAAELLATTASSAVLVVEREATAVAAARRVLEIVGAERFLGAVVLEPASS